MLRTNTKKACANIQAYIMAGFAGDNYGIEKPATFAECAKIIIDTFYQEYYSQPWQKERYLNEFAAFESWAQGLPSIIDTCYYYNRSAVDDLGQILEETEAEKARFTEREAESKLTWLIYRELKRLEV